MKRRKVKNRNVGGTNTERRVNRRLRLWDISQPEPREHRQRISVPNPLKKRKINNTYMYIYFFLNKLLE